MAGISLKVDECSTKDAGRGIARMDPALFSELNISSGSYIKIIGKSETAVKAMPTFIEDRGKKVIKIDSITRENIMANVNEKVIIDRVEAVSARQVVISASGNGEQNITRYLGKAIEGQVVKKGNKIRVNVFGLMNEEMIIEETIPAGFVTVTPNTVFSLHKSEKKSIGNKITYEDVGGLREQIRKIREMVELPLKYGSIFERLGVEAPKGVLLYGPPGTGKTMIAKAVANETSAHFISINGPEIIQKFYGESEANLRKVFDEAYKNSPSIIFIDEIDAIAPKRDRVVGDVEKRVVTQLLTLMDGIKTKGQVAVIGATNMPELIDTALRRPGRFDRELYIGVPDRNGRHEILAIHTRTIPLDQDVNLEKIADITYGFVGADLSNLCREAAMIALRKFLPDMDVETIAYEKIMELKVNMGNFMAALNQVEPSAMREVYIDIPEVTWNDVGGYSKIKEQLKNEVELPVKYPVLFDTIGVRTGRGVLLSGMPGTGKTLMAKALAHETGINFMYIKGPELMAKWIGESERGIREIFKKARLAAPCIMFFDEVDSIAPKRGSGTEESGVAERVLSQMLIEMDGIEKRDGIMIVAATNREEVLDPAMMRPGRIDVVIRIGEPDMEDAVEIFNIYVKRMPVAGKIDAREILSRLKNMTGANIENICKKAGMAAVKRYIENNKNDINKNIKKLKVEKNDFLQAAEMTD